MICFGFMAALTCMVKHDEDDHGKPTLQQATFARPPMAPSVLALQLSGVPAFQCRKSLGFQKP